MPQKILLSTALLLCVSTGVQSAQADTSKGSHHAGKITVQHYNDDGTLTEPIGAHSDMHKASSHAPIGVMGDHLHKKGEWMLSYRYMRMDMKGSRDGQSSLSPAEIVTTVPNRFFGAPMQPPVLRVVPLEMTMDMHMVGAMYGLSDRVTLMAMTSYVIKDMDHVTFQGGMGTTELGRFNTRSEGFGDTSLGVLVGLYETGHHKTHIGLSVSLPTGALDERGDILTPMGGRPTVRLPYAMQLGSGTYDAKPSLTYRGHSENWSWGAQGRAVIRMDENDKNYALGDIYGATAWSAYDVSQNLSLSLRAALQTQGSISGLDESIRGPVQTADPNNFGGDTAEIAAGINYIFTRGALKHNRLAGEFSLPLYRDLNGPQLETDAVFTLGWQRAF